MSRLATRKRQTDQEILTTWIPRGARVLDLGCGRGVLLEKLAQTRGAYVVGVDNQLAKINAVVKRGLNAYQGDIEQALAIYPDGFFDWVICSRTVQELTSPGRILNEALRVGTNLAVGFLNYGYWRNRVSIARTGSRPTNEVFPTDWWHAGPYNPVTIAGFERFCATEGMAVADVVYLRGDWETPLTRWPNLRAGYAVYHLVRG